MDPVSARSILELGSHVVVCLSETAAAAQELGHGLAAKVGRVVGSEGSEDCGRSTDWGRKALVMKC